MSGRGCFDDLPGDEIVVSPPSLIVEPLCGSDTESGFNYKKTRVVSRAEISAYLAHTVSVFLFIAFSAISYPKHPATL